ncbi:MAG: hypothetical protein ABIQ44_09035 [Chloroflexia bacterium]
MFTTEERSSIRDGILAIAKADTRTTAGAMIGSTAGGAEDGWSDIDITFGIAEGNELDAVLSDWTEEIDREFGVVHYWDLPAYSSIYRVFLLRSGMEVDISVTPQPDFGARGPRFNILFGDYRQYDPPAKPNPQYIIGLGWHNVRHIRSCIERGKAWQAEYWIDSLRDQTFALMCLRLGEPTTYRHGVHNLPAELTDPLKETLARSLDEPELGRALIASTNCFLNEIREWDSSLAERLSPTLKQFSGQ